MKEFCLIGEKLGHSYSVDIHNKVYELYNIDARYNLLELTKEEFDNYDFTKFDGINITIPYKVDIIKKLNNISDNIKKINAINTIDNKENELNGYNTDVFGFEKTLEYMNIDINNKTILILGNGGASKAVYFTLKSLGKNKIFIARRSFNHNIKLEPGDRFIQYIEIQKLNKVDLIVNCTPLGMYPDVEHNPIINKNEIESKYLIDLIYNPYKTALMKKYELKGTKVINGLYMLVAQALKSESIWNNNEDIASDETIEKIYNIMKEKYEKLIINNDINLTTEEVLI